MNISATSSYAAGQVSRSQPRPSQEEVLASALSSVGVDDETAADVLSQVQQAVESVQSGSSSDGTQRASVRAAIEGVLEANGIDPAEVDEAIQASRPASGAQQTGDAQQTGGPQRGGRPAGPPPPRGGEDSEDDTSSVESALLSADVAESDIDELLAQMIETISELSADESQQVSSDSIRSALTEVLEENGVDVERFEQALQGELGESGSFFDRVA
ncbi:Clp protease N-terminal domain-containing protein [Roseimaritima ulvae]|uniref:Uncharacterized protein n=1 Tax=Roseimaritima ulvae TaxID=980254 RepID=A0A5B9QU31_9BACT|nr:Clp protease N-terminal domain-containing protein [Roseimaritima ulvae]QEG40915.1 hypothetical protein UC8_29330 [Roseimaritima ulvae]